MSDKQIIRPLTGHELFIEHAACAQTGNLYLVVWARKVTNKRFKVYEIIKDGSAIMQGWKTEIAGNPKVKVYDLSQFDHRGLDCPWCNAAGNLVYCQCGVKSCRGGVYRKEGQDYCAVGHCGCNAMLRNRRKRSFGDSLCADADSIAEE